MKYTEQEILDKIKKFYDAYASLKEKSNMQAQTIERLEKEKAELETKVKDYENRVTSQDSAKKAFDEMGVKKLPKVKELQTEYAKLLEEKKKTYAEYRRSREEMRELLAAKANVDRLLNMETGHDTEREKDHEQR